MALPPIRQEEAFPQRQELTRASCPQRASLEASLWKFQHKHTPTHLATGQTMNNLALLPSRAVFCVSHFCLFTLDFLSLGPWGSIQCSTEKLPTFCKQWTMENLLKRHTPIPGVQGILGVVLSPVETKRSGQNKTLMQTHKVVYWKVKLWFSEQRDWSMWVWKIQHPDAGKS